MDARITEDNGRWTVGTQTFDSVQAAELYLQSRQAQPTVTVWGAIGLMPWYVKAIAAVLVLIAISSLSPSKRAEPNPIEQSRVDRAMAKAESIALLLNMNGQLCARVTGVEYLHHNTYNITCTRYRDGTGSATYELDLDTGQAK